MDTAMKPGEDLRRTGLKAASPRARVRTRAGTAAVIEFARLEIEAIPREFAGAHGYAPANHFWRIACVHRLPFPFTAFISKTLT